MALKHTADFHQLTLPTFGEWFGPISKSFTDATSRACLLTFVQCLIGQLRSNDEGGSIGASPRGDDHGDAGVPVAHALSIMLV